MKAHATLRDRAPAITSVVMRGAEIISCIAKLLDPLHRRAPEKNNRSEERDLHAPNMSLRGAGWFLVKEHRFGAALGPAGMLPLVQLAILSTISLASPAFSQVKTPSGYLRHGAMQKSA
jgi:hypothetical protein